MDAKEQAKERLQKDIHNALYGAALELSDKETAEIVEQVLRKQNFRARVMAG